MIIHIRLNHNILFDKKLILISYIIHIHILDYFIYTTPYYKYQMMSIKAKIVMMTYFKIEYTVLIINRTYFDPFLI